METPFTHTTFAFPLFQELLNMVITIVKFLAERYKIIQSQIVQGQSMFKINEHFYILPLLN